MRFYCMNDPVLFTPGGIPTPSSKLHVDQVFHNIFNAKVVSDLINTWGGREGGKEGGKQERTEALGRQDTSQLSKG